MAHEIEKDWTTAAGLRAVVLVCVWSGYKRHRCGYVGVPKGHFLHGVGYRQQIPEITRKLAESQTLGKKSPILAFTAGVGADDEGYVRRSPDVVFDVHGGLTFSDGDGEYPVPGDLWWFGFDAGHAGDADIETDPKYADWPKEGTTRSLEYMSDECESLARQIAALDPSEAA